MGQCHGAGERGQTAGSSKRWKTGSLRSSKVRIYWKILKPSSFFRGYDQKICLEKMTGHLNHLSSVIENKCVARLTILKHNPRPAQTSGVFLSFTPSIHKQRGVRTRIDPILLTHTIRLSWILVPFSFLAGILYSVSLRRLPHPDVRLEMLP